MNPEGAPRQRGLVMLAKAEKLIADLGPALDKIPKHQRYRYGIRLEDALWELVRRMKRRMREMEWQYARGLIAPAEIRQRIASWVAHASHADSETIRRRVLGSVVFKRLVKDD